MRKVAAGLHFDCSSMICFSSGGIGCNGSRRSCMRPSGALRHDAVPLGVGVVLVRDSRRGSGRRGSPCARWPRSAIASDTVSRLCRSSAVCQPGLYSRLPVTPDLGGARLQLLHALERPLHLVLAADDADQVLHHVLQLVLDLERAAGVARRARTAPAPSLTAASTCSASSAALAGVLLGVLGGVLAGALAEHEQVGQRVAAQPVGAVDARRRTRRRRTAPARATSACRRPRARRPSRSGWSGPTSIGVRGDVEVRQLLELVVHLRQLLLDVLRRRSASFSLIQAMSRNTPPCGLPRPAFTSRMMQRATWSRVSSSGGRRAFLSPWV